MYSTFAKFASRIISERPPRGRANKARNSYTELAVNTQWKYKQNNPRPEPSNFSRTMVELRSPPLLTFCLSSSCSECRAIYSSTSAKCSPAVHIPHYGIVSKTKKVITFDSITRVAIYQLQTNLISVSQTAKKMGTERVFCEYLGLRWFSRYSSRNSSPYMADLYATQHISQCIRIKPLKCPCSDQPSREKEREIVKNKYCLHMRHTHTIWSWGHTLSNVWCWKSSL